MKPRVLNLTAFGPFAASETVDFTRLPSDALFLIHGPTGAGKTSLLDGICYALYGVTSGDERKAKEMRSQHAADHLVTQIEFEFDLGVRRFKVRRSPEYERAKQRGGKDGDNKTITEAAKAELSEWIGDAWVSLSSKSSDVTEKMETLIGFKADQFRQVIMLPQNKFRDFLSADSKARESILETLFSTTIYKQVQDRLRDSAKALESQAKEANTQRDSVLQLSEVEDVSSLDVRIQQTTEALNSLIETSKQIDTQELAAKEKLTQAEVLVGHFKEHAEANEALIQQLAEGPAAAEKLVKLTLAVKAQQVMPTFDIAKDARQQVVAQVAAVQITTTALGSAATNSQQAQAALTAETNRQQERDDATKACTQLDALRDAVSQLNDSEKAWLKAQEIAVTRKQVFDQADTALKQNQTSRDQLAQQLAESSVIAAKFDALTLRKAHLASIKKILTDVTVAKNQMMHFASKEQTAKDKVNSAKLAADQALEKKRSLDLIWRQGQAFVLAKHLENGSPCPVCGSHEHPKLAQDEIDIPSDDDLAQADQAIKSTAEVLEAARSAFETFARDHIAKKTAYEMGQISLSQFDADDVQQIEDKIVDNSEQLSAATTAQALLLTIKSKVEREDAQFKALTESLNVCRTEVETASTQEASTRATYQERLKTVPEQYRIAHALKKAIKEAIELRDNLNNALKLAQSKATEALSLLASATASDQSAKSLLATLESRKADAETALAQALKSNEIANEQTLIDQRLSQVDMDALNVQIKHHAQMLGTAQARVARAAAAIHDQQLPDIAALKAIVDGIRIQSDNLIADRESKRKFLLNDEKAKRALDDINLRLGQISQQYSVLGHLSEIANGKNGRNLTFQRYVLAALLDQVLIQASMRLRVMSNSRYTLQRREDVTDGRRASGLELDVFDDHTGKSRPASTLSGGEGFMAALSLALGLSDVVQSYAGGVQLDTLFIDEGFGSLDPESLETAMKTLIDLRQTGRMVGIISHVEDLKRQIDVGIEIKSGKKGSEVCIFGGTTVHL